MNTTPLSVLVVEDDSSLRTAVRLNLENAGYLVQEAEDGETALSFYSSRSFDLVICDLNMPGMDGISFISKCKERNPDPAIVLITAYGDSELVIKAMKAGAYDHLAKPFTGEELILTLRKIEERENLKSENEALKRALNQRYNFSSIVAKSKAMEDIFETVKRLSQFATTVLISGESGTGKELIAQAIHQNSPRKGAPFVAINCGAIPENLIESELFGHKKGSFTDATKDKKGLFEEADGGTLFLDEIGELPLHLQVKLLRALQEQQIRRVGDELVIPIDVRVIAATLRDLEDDVKEGRFRDDLYYRLNVVSIHIPPLRDRPEDIPLLIQSFIKKHNKRLGLGVTEVTPEAMKALLQHPWRGNVRELENCIERALVLTESASIDLDSLPDTIKNSTFRSTEKAPEMTVDDDNLSIKQKTRDLELNLIHRALEKTKGNRTHAAKILEISHRALLYKLKEYGIGGDKNKAEAPPSADE